MKILKIKRLSGKAIMPTRAHSIDAGLDFYASSMEIDDKNNQVIYGTGIAVYIEPGYAGFMFMRSSVKNKSLILSNGVGVIDAGYIGEITFVYNIPDNNIVLIAKFLRSILFLLNSVLKIYNFSTFADNLTNFIEIETDKQENIYQVGDKIGQLVIMPVLYPEIMEVDTLPETERGCNGYGSSDKIN